jgi:uncharacterized membrane protein YkoI
MHRSLKTTILVTGLVAAAGGTLAFTASQQPEDDEVVQLSNLPAAVQRTIREHAKGGEIEQIERSSDDGKVVYEVEVEGAHGDFEFMVGADGAYLGEDHEEADDDNGDGPRNGGDEDADEEHAEVIKLTDAPNAVRNAFSRLSGGAAASKVERITDEEVTKYEIEFAANGGTASLTLADTGDLLERESPVAADALPEAVRREIQKDFPGATVKAAEAVELHYFEIEVVVDGRTVEVSAFATGDIEDYVGPGGEDDDEHAGVDQDEHDDRGHHEEDDDD